MKEIIESIKENRRRLIKEYKILNAERKSLRESVSCCLTEKNYDKADELSEKIDFELSPKMGDYLRAINKLGEALSTLGEQTEYMFSGFAD